MPTTEESIEKFVAYFRAQIAEVDTHEPVNAALPHQYQRRVVLRKILFVTILDTLARAAKPDGKNHDRIVDFLADCCRWSDRDRVSAQQLLLRLQQDGISSGRLALCPA